MPQGYAARILDPVQHPLPPVLQPGPGSPNVQIGFLPAWRGIPLAAVAALQSAKATADAAVQTAVAATAAAAAAPGGPAAYAAEQALKSSIAASLGAAISSAAAGSGADIHQCLTPAPLPPHGPGVNITGSATVSINFLPASRKGDTILEPLGPPNQIAMGLPTVTIGG